MFAWHEGEARREQAMRLIIAVPIIAALVLAGPAAALNPQPEPPSRLKQKQVSVKKQMKQQTRQPAARRVNPQAKEPGFLRIP